MYGYGLGFSVQSLRLRRALTAVAFEDALGG